MPDDENINTTNRYNHYCHAVANDGRKCSLYNPHESEYHVEKHGHSRWKDGE